MICKSSGYVMVWQKHALLVLIIWMSWIVLIMWNKMICHIRQSLLNAYWLLDICHWLGSDDLANFLPQLELSHVPTMLSPVYKEINCRSICKCGIDIENIPNCSYLGGENLKEEHLWLKYSEAPFRMWTYKWTYSTSSVSISGCIICHPHLGKKFFHKIFQILLEISQNTMSLWCPT